MARRALVLLATMSEFDTIDNVLQEIAESVTTMSAFGWQFELLVIDDGGSEEFRRLCTERGSSYGLATKVLDGPRTGLGGAILAGFDAALSDPGIEYVVNLDADGQHDARQMGDLLRAHVASGAAITIGSRWTKGGRCYGLGPVRKVLSRSSSFVLRAAGVPRHVKDPTTSFRVYGRGAVESISRDLLGFGGFAFFGAAIAVAAARGLTVIETPITFRPRMGGDSNLRAAQVTAAVRDLPRIASVAAMVRRRESGFVRAEHGSAAADSYNASRELEALSATPVSTRIIVDELMPHIGDRVLEVGSGLGLITAALAARGREVTSIEPDPQLFSRQPGIPGVERANCTLAELPDCGQFDTVLYVNVLEHIADDRRELVAAARRLKPGGTVVIFVPAMPSLYGTMDEVSGHFRRYRRAEMESVLRAAGLDAAVVRNFDSVGILPYWLSYRILRRKVLGGAAVGLYDKVIIPVSSLVSRMSHGRGPGKNIIAVGSPRTG